MRSRFQPDRRLTARMLVTLFLLGLLYVGFVAALIVLLKSVVLVVVLAALLLGAQYWFSDRIALFAMHGRIVSREQAPRLHGVVDRLCAAADMPKPEVAISGMDMPNAFATGRNPSHAVVCVTDGLQRRLEPEELEGVLAHELSHVAHRDVAVMTIASFLGVIAGLVVRFAFYSSLFRGQRDQNTVAVLGVVVGVSIAVYSISFVLIRALSRYRELAADRAGALLTGRPSALASALTKVTGDIARIPTRDLRTAKAFNAFYFTPALGNTMPMLSRVFSTHPSLEQRLDQLAMISAQLGPAGDSRS